MKKNNLTAVGLESFEQWFSLKKDAGLFLESTRNAMRLSYIAGINNKSDYHLYVIAPSSGNGKIEFNDITGSVPAIDIHNEIVGGEVSKDLLENWIKKMIGATIDCKLYFKAFSVDMLKTNEGK